MRYLKSYKLFEGVKSYLNLGQERTHSFKELFYNFKDDGFDISITENNTQKLDFSKKYYISKTELI